MAVDQGKAVDQLPDTEKARVTSRGLFLCDISGRRTNAKETDLL